jgi:carboxyl-terminal processing protease
MRALAPAPILLLDLRGNRGGSISPVVYLAEHLLGPGHAVATFRYRTGQSRRVPVVQDGPLPDEGNAASASDVALNARHGFVEWRTARSAPMPRVRRLFVLVDGGCASSCDAFAAVMKESRVATLLGAATAGELLSSVLFRTAWRGYALLAPVGSVTSPGGMVIEGVGVAPDVALPQCDVNSLPPAGTEDACLTAALEWIGRHKDSAESSLRRGQRP